MPSKRKSKILQKQRDDEERENEQDASPGPSRLGIISNPTSPSSSLRSSPPPSLSLEDMTISNRVPLTLISIGNPTSQYANTYHSAGHVLLNLLQPHAERHGWSTFASKAYMNLSGPAVWNHFKKDPSRRLVVLHDELEKPVGWVGILDGKRSARGHRGIQSIHERIPRNVEWSRLAIGIGRPESRDPNVVADYVLRKMKGQEIAKIEARVGDVVDMLLAL